MAKRRRYIGYDTQDEYDMDFPDRNMIFADPGSGSALRAASEDNPRNRPCPSCGAKNVLTPADVALGYQCNRCADSVECCGDKYSDYHGDY